MRIVQISPYFYPHVGGVESHVLALSKELIKKNNEVLVITSNFSNLKEREFVGDIEVLRLKPLSIVLSSPITPRIMRALLNEKYDLVHGHSPPPFCTYFAAKGCKELNKHFVITYHCDLEVPYVFGNLLTNLYGNTFGLYTLRHATKIIVTTRTYGATSRTIWKYEPVVIPNAVDTERFNPSVKGEEIKENPT